MRAKAPAHRIPGKAQRAGRVLALCEALLSERGEVSGARLASYALSAYRSLDPAARELFLTRLATEFTPDADQVRRAAARFAAEASPANLVTLQAVVESPRQELFRRANQAPGGTAALIDLRRQVLGTLPGHPERAGIDADLLHLLRSWFNRGFLNLQRIDWRTPAVVLERLIQYEAVHQINGWRDLHRRLEGDRRCYAFFHPSLPDEPLIFIEVALTRGMPARVQPLIDPDSPIGDAQRADCAIFYSITNCQEGLRGVSFGSFLIKQVVDDLGRELPGLKTFATMSPVPGFRRWLSDQPANLRYSKKLQALLATFTSTTPPEAEAIPGTLREEITGLCVEYLLRARRHGAALDPVARFHLSNGACLQRLNWMADSSPAGLTRSLGMMANYVYRAGDVERNHEAYARNGTVTVSRSFARSVPSRPRSRART
ncbi:MAG: malonyl-CoA decarboxylase [Vicinamibacterales bacterium]